MKNHFIIPYFGNKRDEVENIYKILVDEKCLDENIKIICEPYCGSSAMSVYISLLHPKQYKYILNDNCQELIELYYIMKDTDKLKDFIATINEMVFKNGNWITKPEYDIIIKNQNIYSYFIKNKFYKIIPGMYPPATRAKPLDINNILKLPIIYFLQTEDVELNNKDAIEVLLKNNNNSECLSLIDPPYLSARNDYYDNHTTNIYEYQFYNPTILKKACFILENIWIIKLLFNNNKRIEYDKKYKNTGRKSKHAIIILKENNC